MSEPAEAASLQREAAPPPLGTRKSLITTVDQMHRVFTSKEPTEDHERDRDGEAEEDDPHLNQQGCGKVYAALEECLAENDRDWRACQKEVQAWKLCYQRAQQGQDPGTPDSRK